MKLPSLFRTPKYQRFHIEPRYYDPVKERIEERTEQIKRQLEASDEPDGQYHTRIRGSFTRRRKEAGANILRMLLILVLFGTCIGYFFYGNAVFYAYLVLIPLYIFARRKSFFRS